jgi:PAS domain S-box-containing protein
MRITKRRKGDQFLPGQEALVHSQEELLKIFVKRVPAGVAIFDCNMRYLQVSDRWCADYSVDSSMVLGCSHYELLPDIPSHWKEMHRRGIEGETLRSEEDRWEREDGTTKWARWEIRPWRTSTGVIGGILILAEDITPRKLLEEAISDMGQKLIIAQEHERARIARELHDDIGQRLALLATELSQIQQDYPGSRMDEIWKQTSELESDIQSLSHELHSSTLEHLGLASAISSFCKEFGERQKLEIDFRAHDLPGALPPDISLCLFRVLQEALHNSAKHSEARHIEVRLWGTSEEITLTARDSGVGFERDAAKENRGLGLMSMRERVRLVKGELSIESRPGRGTTIRACVPFQTRSDSITPAALDNDR